MKDLIRNGTKIYHTLTGDMDTDRFMDKWELSDGHKNLLEACYHQGECDHDCNEAAQYFEIKNYEEAKRYLTKEVGIESDALKTDGHVLNYYLWLLSADLHDDGFFEPEQDDTDADDYDETADEYRRIREDNLK